MKRPSPDASISVTISEELFATSTITGAGLLDAMKVAARARGFLAIDVGEATDGAGVARLLSLSTGNGKGGARVRADLGPHAQPIAAVAARVMGVPVTMVAASGIAKGARGKLTMSFAVRAVQVDRNGRAHALRVEGEEGDFEQEDDLDWSSDKYELLRAGYDYAGNVLGDAVRALSLSLDDDGPRVAHRLRRPRG